MRPRKVAGIFAKITFQFALALMPFGGFPVSAQVVITPSTPPVVNQRATFKFTANTTVIWSCPGCAGTIDPDGTYHAPQNVKSQQSYGGYQLLPNDHIYNTRIDSLPVNLNSAAWIAGAGTVGLGYLETSFPINYCTTTTCPPQNMFFYYTPTNNGSYEVPQYPQARIEGGWFSAMANQGSIDHHLWSIDTITGTFTEFYQYVPTGNIAGCSNCNSDSGLAYLPSTYTLPANGSTDAAGLYVMPLVLKLQEMEQAVATGGTINHALRFTLQNGYIKSNSLIWPATATTSAGGGVVPYGARFRLKSSFNISSFSPIAQILLTQLKQYGLILADGGTGWATQPELTYWPQAFLDAFNEIGAANIKPTSFEAVDESGLMVSPLSGATTLSETVVATGIANPSLTARQQVVLTGVTLNLPKDELYIQAGSGPQMLIAYIHGSSNGGITWTMSPALGTLDSSTGLFTPPASVSTAMVTTVTATSNADPTVAATETITIYPAGPIRLVFGQQSPYTDTNGNVWQNQTGGDMGPQCIYDDGGSWPNTPDITLYEKRCQAGDLRFDISVPNGSYNVTGLFTESDPAVTGPTQRLFNIESEGKVVVTNYDIFAAAGGSHLPVNNTVSATVTNGMLSYVLRYLGKKGTRISALQIVPISLIGTNPNGPPAPPPDLSIINVK